MRKDQRLGMLPDPFICRDGHRVKNLEEWKARRREILEDTIGLEFDGMPPKPEVFRVEPTHLRGKGCTSSYRIHCGTKDNPFSFCFYVYRPVSDGKLPVVLTGDLTYTMDCNDEVIAEANRRGFIVVKFNRNELAPDYPDPDRQYGINALWPDNKFSAISAWAWGYHQSLRCPLKVMQGSLNSFMHIFNKGGVLISAYQRMIWFHNRVAANAYPNAGTLAEQFEISNRQAQRDIEYMRDSMNAPLLYCARKRGYLYEKEYVLPSFFLSESEKETVRSLAKQSKELSSFGYGKYKGQAEILSKISAESGNGEDDSGMTREPYFAEIEMLGGRASVAPLDYFLCGKVEGHTCTYAFFDPDVFISVLIAGGLDFRIIKPNWLREYMKEKLSGILKLL